VNDTDEKCRAEINKRFGYGKATQLDFFKEVERNMLFGFSGNPDLVYLDFNNFTIAKSAKGEYRAELDGPSLPRRSS
jgi:hypothetical protein